jgi:large subunit ribosomal protein L20
LIIDLWEVILNHLGIYFLIIKIENMPRSVNSVASRKRRKKILKQARGYFGARSKVYTVAKNAVEKALGYAYRDRKAKKRTFRRLWIARINAAARQEGLSYSVFIHKLKQNNVELNRKVLADLAMNHPTAFKAVVDSVNK